MRRWLACTDHRMHAVSPPPPPTPREAIAASLPRHLEIRRLEDSKAELAKGQHPPLGERRNPSLHPYTCTCALIWFTGVGVGASLRLDG
jgi:hypothetical protein